MTGTKTRGECRIFYAYRPLSSKLEGETLSRPSVSRSDYHIDSAHNREVQREPPLPPVQSDSQVYSADGEIAAAFSSGSVFQAVTWIAWTSWCAAIYAAVFSPRIASRTTRALNDAEWFRLGSFMDLCPSVAILHRHISTYTPARKAAATPTGCHKVFDTFRSRHCPGRPISGPKDLISELFPVIPPTQAS